MCIGQESPSTITLNQTQGDNITAGNVFCHNISSVIEFTCIGVKVPFLQWQRNSQTLYTFTLNDNSGISKYVLNFSLFLDSNSMTAFANMSSRLVANLSDLRSGDEIKCIYNIDAGIKAIKTIDYSIVCKLL